MSGLRNSCDASDTNCRCRCDDWSSRSSIAFIVRARRPTSSSVSGSGTRRWMVEPVISSASVRIASTGRSARPVKYQTANPTSSTSRGTATNRMSLRLSTVLLTSSSDRCATSTTSPTPPSGFVDLTRTGPLRVDVQLRFEFPVTVADPRGGQTEFLGSLAPLELGRQLVELLFVRLLDARRQVAANRRDEPERCRDDGDREHRGGDQGDPPADAHVSDTSRYPAPRTVSIVCASNGWSIFLRR